MAKTNKIGWDNKMMGCPKIEGNLEISKNQNGIFIGGDAIALRSLAKLLVWLADVDQESLTHQPDGERCHVHLYASDAVGFNSLTPFSIETELCRLDAKGTGEFPERYHGLGKETKAKGSRKGAKGKEPKRL